MATIDDPGVLVEMRTEAFLRKALTPEQFELYAALAAEQRQRYLSRPEVAAQIQAAWFAHLADKLSEEAS